MRGIIVGWSCDELRNKTLSNVKYAGSTSHVLADSCNLKSCEVSVTLMGQGDSLYEGVSSARTASNLSSAGMM